MTLQRCQSVAVRRTVFDPISYAEHFIAIALFVGAFVGTAVGQSWFDTFDDGSFSDGSPVTWSTDLHPAFSGQYDTSSGDFVFFPPRDDVEDEVMVAWVDDISYSSVGSVRTRTSIRTDDSGTITGQGNVGPLLFVDSVSSYFGVLDAGGNLRLFESHGGDSTQIGSDHVGYNPTEGEVYVQVNHDGTHVSLEAWRVGEPQPDRPNVIVPSTTFTSGSAGLIFAEDSFQDVGVFHYARAADVARILDGDMDIDGDVDAVDIDTLYQNIGSSDPLFDVNEDCDMDLVDVEHLVRNILRTDFGDANLDEMIDDLDFGIWNQNVLTEGLGWAAADFDGDGFTDGSDFNIWNDNRTNGVGSLPEPAGLALFLMSLPILTLRWRKASDS
jgi:hypothetical protein